MLKCIESTMAGKNLDYDYLSRIKRRALKLGIQGIVFFQEDGSVKVIAEGEEKNLLFFVEKLRRPSNFFTRIFSSTENFSVIWHEPKHEFEGFSVS